MGIALRIIMAIAVPVLMVVVSVPARAETGPFSWDGQQWCPNFAEQSLTNCNDVQHNNKHANVWNPTQVSIDSSGNLIEQALNKPYTLKGTTYPYQSGSVNTDPLETFGTGTFFARLNFPCDSNGNIYNWPAFIVTGADVAGNPPWPASGEIDVVEGLGGQAAWHYHYQKSDGTEGSYGGKVSGNFCGWHSFEVERTSTTLTFIYDGNTVGTVTKNVVDYPMLVRIAYGIGDGTDGSPGGPVNASAAMMASCFAYAPIPGGFACPA